MSEQNIQQQLRVLQASIDYFVGKMHMKSTEENLARLAPELKGSEWHKQAKESFKILDAAYNNCKADAAKPPAESGPST